MAELAVCYGEKLHEVTVAINPNESVFYCGINGKGPGAKTDFPANPKKEYTRIVKYCRTYFNWFSQSNREIVQTDLILWAEGATPDGWIGCGTVLD